VIWLGLSGIVSAAFITIILLSGAAYVVTMNINMMKDTIEPLEEYMVRERFRLGESCTIDSWVNSSLYGVDINITNVGENGIRLSKFSEIDVILTYNTSSGIVVDWIPFDQDGVPSSFWKMMDVFTDGQQGDYVNPLNFSGDLYGIWDPGETIEIRIITADIATSYKYLKITLPYGTVTGTSMV